jgi:hypothetical protein
MDSPQSTSSIEDRVYDSCDATRIYLSEAIKATSNLPKGMNRTALIVAFMEIGVAALLADQARGNHAN